MKKNVFKNLALLVILTVLFTFVFFLVKTYLPFSMTKADPKLYWFIPDGMRADPDLFNIFKWAEEGKLPNIKTMMEKGSYGYAIPVFPGHTPVNFATLLTGTFPKTHGIADGPMHIEGKPLDKVAVGGFRSVARKIPAIWSTLENNKKNVAIISIPGSTPPEIDDGIVVRGRWGGWGADFHALNIESMLTGEQRRRQGRGTKLFFFGPELTKYVTPSTAKDWNNIATSFSPSKEVEIDLWGGKLFAYIYDSTDDKTINYDHILLSKDKNNHLATLKQSDWSSWNKVTLNWNDTKVETDFIFNLIKLDNDGFFRLRFIFNNLNEYITQPANLAAELTAKVGPMIDFVDNYPAQLIYYQEDKKTFLEEMNMTFNWHSKFIPYFLNTHKPDVVIHDIYSPNQMLTSRWWLGYIDKASTRFNDITEPERKVLENEVLDMYKKLDEMVGAILKNSDKNTVIAVSSDHGACVLNKWVHINNLLAANGLLKFKISKETGMPLIDWKNSQAIYLKMDNIYIHPNGLHGDWKRASGAKYEALRKKITALLLALQDDNGENPISGITRWEDVRTFLDLPEDRVGDLIISNKVGYGWNEEMSEDLKLFTASLPTGYKQAINPRNEKCIWTPFLIMGPGVKKNNEIKKTMRLVDQYPTIMKLLNQEIPSFVEGEVIKEIIE